MTFNHAFTIGFAVPGSKYENWEDCLQHERSIVLLALLDRLLEIRENRQEFMEAIDGFDTYEETK